MGLNVLQMILEDFGSSLLKESVYMRCIMQAIVSIRHTRPYYVFKHPFRRVNLERCMCSWLITHHSTSSDVHREWSGIKNRPGPTGSLGVGIAESAPLRKALTRVSCD